MSLSGALINFGPLLAEAAFELEPDSNGFAICLVSAAGGNRKDLADFDELFLEHFTKKDTTVDEVQISERKYFARQTVSNVALQEGAISSTQLQGFVPRVGGGIVFMDNRGDWYGIATLGLKGNLSEAVSVTAGAWLHLLTDVSQVRQIMALSRNDKLFPLMNAIRQNMFAWDVNRIYNELVSA